MEKEYHKLTIKPVNPDINIIDDPTGDYHRLTSKTNTLTLSHREQPTAGTINFILGTYKKGNPGDTPYIGENGNWWISGEDTGTKATGNDGVGISNWELISSVGKVKTYRITFSNDTTFEYTITDGIDGRGIVSIIKTSTEEKTDTYTITYTDGTTTTFEVVNGLDGISVVSITLHETVGLVDTYEILYSSGSRTYFNVTNGADGKSAYQSALDGGYTGTESEFNELFNSIDSHIADNDIHHSAQSLADAFEPKNSNIQEHIGDATKHIDSTAEFTDPIDETNDKFTIWDNSVSKWIKFSFTKMKEWLSSLYLKLDQSTPQTILGLLQNKSTAALESAPLGAEELSSSNWTTAGWTGDFVNGFTHTTGNVTPLTNTLAAVNNTLYQITYTITNRTAGSINITFGGVATGAVTSSGAIGNRTASTGSLSIAPTTDFNGTLVISIKKITGIYNPTYQILDSTGIGTLEIRSSLNTLNNTFIGKGAGRYNTTGTSNNFNGYQAGYGNTTGSFNNFNGYQAGYGNTTGSFNNFNAYRAGYSNTTGSFNNFNAYRAGYSNTTGSYNNFNGYQAGYNTTIGSYNNFNGALAGLNNITGSNNNFNGFNSGRYLADGVTANQNSNNSVFDGANTKSKQANQTNEIVIGYNAIGNGSNTATIGHTDITDTYLRGRVHISGSVQIADDTAVASSANVGTFRYRTTANASYVDMCMQTGVNSYSWINIVTNTW